MELGSGLGTGDGILEMLGSKLLVGFGDTLGFAEGGTRVGLNVQSESLEVWANFRNMTSVPPSTSPLRESASERKRGDEVCNEVNAD